jgi:hypothetical protein
MNEYQVLEVNHSELQIKLNDQAQYGWRLAAVTLLTPAKVIVVLEKSKNK